LQVGHRWRFGASDGVGRDQETGDEHQHDRYQCPDQPVEHAQRRGQCDADRDDGDSDPEPWIAEQK